MNHLKINYTAASNQGQRRSNQDNLCVGRQLPFIEQPEHPFSAEGSLLTDTVQIFCVCDGVGGARMGDIAALMALEAVSQAVYTAPQQPLTDLVLEAAEAAQKSVTSFFSSLGHSGGCTLVLLAVHRKDYVFVNIGDSPAFHWMQAENELTELSCRHNLEWHKQRMGLEPEPGDSRYLMAYIGKVGMTVKDMAHIAAGTLEPGDCLLLCSDGITNAIDGDDLRDALCSGADANTLATSAADVEYADNCTAICLTVGEAEEP